jgi:hypothetical protein
VFWHQKISLPVQKLNYLQFYHFCGYKKGKTKKNSPSSFDAVVGYGIRDPRSGIQDG